MELKENIGMETKGMIKVKDVPAVLDQATNASSKYRGSQIRVIGYLAT